MKEQGVRVAVLDGVRGAASLMVIAYHFGPHIVRNGGPFEWLHWVPPFWFQGVDLFFVLSGFLISGILVTQRSATNYFAAFYTRRAYRIFPIYYVVLGGYVATIFIVGSRVADWGRLFEHPITPWWYVIYVQNIAMAAANDFGPFWLSGTWSLAVEEQFYFTLPLVVRRLGDHALALSMGGAALAAVLLRAVEQKLQFWPGLSNYVLLPNHFDVLALGVLVMLAWRKYEAVLRLHYRRLRAVTTIVFLFWTLYPFLPNPHHVRMAFLDTFGNAITWALCLMTLLAAPSSGLMRRCLSSSPMRTLGRWAYCMYLVHPVLLCILFQIWRHHDPALDGLGDVPPIVAAFLLTAMLAAVSWHYVEGPFISRGHRTVYRNAAPPRQAAGEPALSAS